MNLSLLEAQEGSKMVILEVQTPVHIRTERQFKPDPDFTLY